MLLQRHQKELADQKGVVVHHLALPFQIEQVFIERHRVVVGRFRQHWSFRRSRSAQILWPLQPRYQFLKPIALFTIGQYPSCTVLFNKFQLTDFERLEDSVVGALADFILLC